MNSTKYYTTPIYYVNSVPHIGHAYTNIMTDIIARYQKAIDNNVFVSTGTDEHGLKVEQSATANNMTPKEFCDNTSKQFRLLCTKLNMCNDVFIRTTDNNHKIAATAIWETLLKKGVIYLSKYKGYYAIRDEAFYDESEIIEGKAPTGAPVELVEDESYFFALEKYREQLLEYYENNPDAILPHTRRNEVISFIKSGLKDISISRTRVKWGIPVPNAKEHTMYVWIDALTNYLTVLGYPNTKSENFHFWNNAIHIIGKEILRFHAIYWPAILLAADLQLPKCIYAHGWLTINGEKMSKSLGNVIDPFFLIDEYGLDEIRYYFARYIPFGSDGDFSIQKVERAINYDLANDLGNLFQRTLSMIMKKNNGIVNNNASLNTNLSNIITDTKMQFIDNMNKYDISKATECVFGLVTNLNKYINEIKPWQTEQKYFDDCMITLLTGMKAICNMLAPIMPIKAKHLLSQLQINTFSINECDSKYNIDIPIEQPSIMFYKRDIA